MNLYPFQGYSIGVRGLCHLQSGPPGGPRTDSDTPGITHRHSPVTEHAPHAAPRVAGAAAPDHVSSWKFGHRSSVGVCSL